MLIPKLSICGIFLCNLSQIGAGLEQALEGKIRIFSSYRFQKKTKSLGTVYCDTCFDFDNSFYFCQRA